MTSRQALFTFLPFYFFTFKKSFKLYVCFQELQRSFYLQRLGAGWHYDAFAALERNLITLVVGYLCLALQTNQNHETIQF